MQVAHHEQALLLPKLLDLQGECSFLGFLGRLQQNTRKHAMTAMRQTHTNTL